MLGYGADALDLVRIGHVECLDAAVVVDAPKFDHALGVCCDEAVEVWKAIDSDQGVLMTIKNHDRHVQVWIPHKDVKVEAT